MAGYDWPTKRLSVASLHLDTKNPRLGREVTSRAPRDIIQYLFDNDKAADIAESIARRGFFPNEPLLAVREKDQLVVVEGNRRLGALKALKQPGLIEGAVAKQVERFSRMIADPAALEKVPVTIAPTRKATDQLLVGRHVGTAVLPWQAENRASFILDKLTEGYTDADLAGQLGFTASDIQQARQTRAIADMARSLDLPDEIKAKLDLPRTKIFSTLERVFDSTEGRKFLGIKSDEEHGIRGTTTKAEFLKGFKKLVTDLAIGKETSRSLNTNEDMRRYVGELKPADRPQSKRGSFVPSDVVKGKTVSAPAAKPPPKPKPAKTGLKTVLPRDLKIRFGNERLVDIRRELVSLKRDKYPNAGAVLLRVFLELAVVDYLKRTGEMDKLIARLKAKSIPVPFGVPTMKYLAPETVKLAKAKLTGAEAKKVEKALKYDPAAPFSISELHGFVHQDDLPSDRDIYQFWLRTEPLLRLMLEQESGTP